MSRSDKLSAREEAVMAVLRDAGMSGAKIEALYDAYLLAGAEPATAEQIQADHRRQQQIVGAVISRIHKKRPSIHIKPGERRHTYVSGRRRST